MEGQSEILVVDDERAFREGMKAMLAAEGFAVRTARDGEDAVAKFVDRRPDLVLLDVMMPKSNGFRACEDIRRVDPRVPVVFLTAKDAEADELRALGAGADDYISKSAPEPLLLARVRRALERTRAFAGPGAGGGDVVSVGCATVNLMTRTVSVPGRAEERLTRTEADILRVLASERGRRFSVDELITALRGRGFACEDTMVYVHVSHLRRKLGPAGDALRSGRDAGYCLPR